MEQLELETYKCILPNSTFVRGLNVYSEDGRHLNCVQMAQIDRFYITSTRETLERISSNATIFLENPASIEEKQKIRPSIGLLKHFGTGLIELIAEKDKKVLEYLGEQRIHSILDKEEHYVRFMNGIFSLSFFEEFIPHRNRPDFESGCRKALLEIAAIKQNFVLRLSSEELQPNRIFLNYLIDNEVKDCRYFFIPRGNDNQHYSECAESLRILNKAFNPIEKIELLRDNSEEILENDCSVILGRSMERLIAEREEEKRQKKARRKAGLPFEGNPFVLN